MSCSMYNDDGSETTEEDSKIHKKMCPGGTGGDGGCSTLLHCISQVSQKKIIYVGKIVRLYVVRTVASIL